jgi:hypothetical protein
VRQREKQRDRQTERERAREQEREKWVAEKVRRQCGVLVAGCSGYLHVGVWLSRVIYPVQLHSSAAIMDCLTHAWLTDQAGHQ